MAWTKVMKRAGRREDHQALDTLRKNTTIPRRVGKKREEAEGVGDCGEVTRVLTHKTAGHDGGGGRTCTINIQGVGGSCQAHHRWEGHLQRIQEGWAKEAPDILTRHGGSL